MLRLTEDDGDTLIINANQIVAMRSIGIFTSIWTVRNTTGEDSEPFRVKEDLENILRRCDIAMGA